ncbi:MAG: Hpt domain-containing protein [Desulfobacterales bacterium]|nr:Hpt domain-containing protein [Desulfobacterales bacterium]
MNTHAPKDKIIVHVDSDLEDLIPDFLTKRQKEIDIIQQALRQSDFNTIYVLGHGMKGSGGAYGFDRLTEIGAVLEKSAKEQNIFSIIDCIEKLSDYFSRIEVKYC